MAETGNAAPIGHFLQDGELVFAFAHELRTYLRTVVTRIQLVQSSASSVLSSEEQHALAAALGAAREINGLVTAMAGYCDLPQDQAVVSLQVLFRGLAIELGSALKEAGATLQITTEIDVPVPAGLKGVLRELVANSIRFRSVDRPLQIVVSSRRTIDSGVVPPEATLEITVRDNGIGVEAAFLEKIFAPFQRLHSRDEFPGFGLGLATCRRLVEHWGGSIRADSGEGLTLRIVIPSSLD